MAGINSAGYRFPAEMPKKRVQRADRRCEKPDPVKSGTQSADSHSPMTAPYVRAAQNPNSGQNYGEFRANRLAACPPSCGKRDRTSSDLRNQASMRPHSAPEQNWRGNTAPSSAGLHPKPVENWNWIS